MPEHSILFFLAAFVAPLLLNLLFTPLILYLSHKFNWFDELDRRKVHTGEVPRLGGVGFFLSFALVFAFVMVFFPDIFPRRQGIFLLLGFATIHVLGLFDDFRNIPARFKLLGQICAAILVVLGGSILPGVEIFGVVISFGIFAAPLTVFWLISLSNGMNLIDGVDGLAGGVSFFAALCFAIILYILEFYSGALLAILLAGSLVPFLLFNKPVAKIFMGDSGSLFLGFVLGSLFFLGDVTQSHLQYGGISITMTLLVVPILDLIAAIVRRLRKGLPIFTPDREHLHHKLLDFGFSVPKILLIIYFWVLIAGSSGILWAFSEANNFFPSWIAELVLLFVWVGSVIVFSKIHYKNQRLKQSESPDS